MSGDGKLKDFETDYVPSSFLFLSLAFLALILLGSGVALTQFFKAETYRGQYELNFSRDNPDLLNQKTKDTERLNTYRRGDQTPYRYQVPIDRAMQVLVDSPERLKGTR
jgi:hypothetical protein